jgi:hypothetical protein
MALTQARGRIAIGLWNVVMPGVAGRVWIGDDARRPAVKLIARAFGVRDAVLGLGVVVALDRGAPVRGWLEACAVADGVDAAATFLAGDSIPAAARRGVLALAIGSSAAAAWLSRQLDEPVGEDEVHAPEAKLTGHP